VVAAITRTRNQILNYAPRALPIIVGALVSPAIVEGHAGFPSAAFLVRGDLLFRCGEVTRKFVSVVDDDVRLKLKDHLVHALGFPGLSIKRPSDVVPKNVNFSVVGQKLAKLGVNVFHEAFSRGLIRGTARTVRMVPIHKRIVEAYAHAFRTRSFDI